jgi:hypothetical protein
MIPEGYGAGPRMIRLIRGFWQDAIMVCHAAGNYGTAFKAGRGITQGGPLSAKLFNILVVAVVRKWVWQFKEDGDYKEGELAALTATFFAIFYVDDTYLASRDAGFLQHALTLLVNLFQRVGLQTNTSKMQTMICTPGWIWTQLPTKLYRRMQHSRVTAAKWNSRNVQCHQCGKGMKAGSLGRHLEDVHGIYQQTVVTKDLLEYRPPAMYTINAILHGIDLSCCWEREYPSVISRPSNPTWVSFQQVPLVQRRFGRPQSIRLQ